MNQAFHALRVVSTPASVERARRFVLTVCVTEGVDEETTETAQLAISELLTNSVIHGASDEVELRLGVQPDVVVGEVTDHGAGMPRLLEAPLGAEGGRGLAIVAAVSAAWGVRTRAGGKTVWFELRRATLDDRLSDSEDVDLRS